MLGAAASIIPGFGAIGAGVSTVADIYDDLQDNGKIDNWGTHAMNAGFIALSAVGLGGLKTAQAGYKAAKLARLAGIPAARAERLAALTAKVEKTGFKTLKTVNDLDKVESGVVKLAAAKGTKSFQGAGLLKEEFNALKQAGLIGKKVNSGQIIKKGLAKEVSNTFKTAKALDQETLRAAQAAAKPAVVPQAPGFLAREFSGTLDLLGGITKPGMQKAASIAGKGLRGAGLVAGGLSAARAATGLVTEGTEGVNVNDVKGALYLAGGLRGFMKSRQLAKQITDPKFFGATKATPATISIGKSKPIVLKNELELPKMKMLGGKKENAETLKKFKEELKAAVGDKEIFKQHFKNIKDLKGIKITPAKENISGKLLTQSKSGLSPKEYTRLKSALEGKVNNYFLPNWTGNGYLKEGGVIKLQGGGSAATGFQGLNFKGIGNILGKVNFDNTDFLNLLNFAQTRRSNDRNTTLQQQAVDSAVTKANAMPAEYIRVSNTSKPYYDAQATGVMNVAKRMARNTSDPSLAASIMYNGVGRAKEASSCYKW